MTEQETPNPEGTTAWRSWNNKLAEGCLCVFDEWVVSSGGEGVVGYKFTIYPNCPLHGDGPQDDNEVAHQE